MNGNGSNKRNTHRLRLNSRTLNSHLLHDSGGLLLNGWHFGGFGLEVAAGYLFQLELKPRSRFVGGEYKIVMRATVKMKTRVP